MKNCNDCKKTKCPKACFNAHPGSITALNKLLKEIRRTDVYVCGGENVTGNHET